MLLDKVNKLREKFCEFKTESKQQSDKNMSKIKEIIATLKDKCPNTANEIAVDDLSLLPDFPLSSTEEYFEFNDRLQSDEAIRKCFVSICINFFAIFKNLM